jgi:hypothetical protein
MKRAESSPETTVKCKYLEMTITNENSIRKGIKW